MSNRINFNRFPQIEYAAQEAVNTFCTNVKFLGDTKRCIMITSCQAHEGKTTLSMNTMRTLANLGHTVVLVDCDLRRSQICEKYGVKQEKEDHVGLTHYLAGLASLSDVVYETDISGAYFVPVGHLVSNSLALLSTPRLPSMIQELKKAADYVIVDAPPVGMIIDAAEISKCCDGTVIAIQYNAIDKRELAAAQQQIERAGCPVLGCVLTQVSFDSIASKKYYHKSYYNKYDKNYYNRNKKE